MGAPRGGKKMKLATFDDEYSGPLGGYEDIYIEKKIEKNKLATFDDEYGGTFWGV